MIEASNERYIQKYVGHTLSPIRKEEFLSVNIDDMVHQFGVQEHAKSLIAWVLLKPKVEPMSTSALRALINSIWDVPRDWKFLPLRSVFVHVADICSNNKFL